MKNAWISATFYSLWRWSQFAAGPTGAAALLSLTTLAANVIIFRLMPEVEAGYFALLTALAQTLALLTGLGQGNLTRRLYTLHALGHFDWPRDLGVTILLVGPLAGAASLIANRLYTLSLNATLFVFTVTLALITVTSLSQMLGSQRQYLAGSIVLRLPYNLLFLALLPFPLLPADRRLTYVAASLLACYAFTIGCGLFSLYRGAGWGAARITLRDRAQGAAFVISGLAYQLPEEGLFSLAGTLLAAPELAAVAALTLLLRPFGLLFDSLNQILLTELARRPRLRYWQMLAALAGLTLAASLGALALAPATAHLLYNGRYDSFQYLTPLLVAGSALQLAEVLGRAHINARATRRRLNLFILTHTGIALAGAALTLGLISQWGVIGLAAGTAIIYAVRNLASYSFSLQLNRETSLPTH